MLGNVLMIYILSSLTVDAFVPIIHGIHARKPYSFGYTVKDKHGEQHREESGDGVAVRGSYGFTDERGIRRQVNYVADHAGFRAEVKTNEPGTASLDPAAVKMESSAHPYFGAGVGFLGGLGHAPGGLFHGGLAPIAPLAYPALPKAEFIPPPFAAALSKDIGAGFAVPLLGGAVKGYDTRYGIY